jgi:hypothetical protein
LTNGFTYNAAVAIGFAQVAAATPQSSTATVPVAYPAAQTAGDLNVVVVGWNDTAATVQSVKDSGGNNYSLAIGPTSGTALRQSIYYAPNIKAGSNTVTVTFSQAAVAPDVRILEYRGVTTVDVTAGASGSSTTASSGAATTTVANELIFGAATVFTAVTGAGSGFTSRIITNPDGDNAEDKVVTTTGSNSATAPVSPSGAWVMQMVTFSASSGPAPVAAAPAITSATTASGTAGIAFSYQITATNSPTSYGATGLPAGLSFNSSTGLISGTPTAAGTSTVTLSATNSGGTGGASLTLTMNPAPAPAGQLTSSPASLAFGSAQVGSSATLTDSLTNTGGSSVTISQATAKGTGFSISGLTVPLTLNPGASVTFSAVYAPQSAGSASGGITVVSSASNSTLTVSLSGTGTAPGTLTIAPTALSFGNATVGTSVSQASSLSAAGTSVTVSSASLSSAEFSITGISLPVTIAAGQSVPVTMTFTPQASGSASGVLTVGSNGSNTATQSLSGVGVAPTQHSVSLSWTDTNSGITGYNIYRGNASGGPYTEINSGLDSTTAYSDTSVVAGQTYYYVATAVNESGAESAYSNETQAVIPSP